MAFVHGDSNAVLKDLTIIAEQTVIQTRPQLQPLICSSKPEEGAYTRVPIAANMPLPRKLEGERAELGKDVTVTQTYTQDTYELTIDLSSDLVRNAKAYDFSDLIAEGSVRMVTFPDYQASQLVINGASTNAYDSVAFYNSGHHYANVSTAPTINNTVNKTGQTVTALAADLGSALSAIRTFQDNAGVLLNPIARQGADQLLIHCPCALEQAFRQVIWGSVIPVSAPVTTSGTAAAPAAENVLKGIAGIYPDGYLDANSTTAWYLHFVGMPQRPFIFLENYPTIVKVLGFNSEFETNTNKVRIAMKRRFVLGYYRFDRSIKVS